jgi:small subunit ribosomal protein S2
MEKKSSVTIPSMESMLESGVHFGHQVTRWNPKMKKYIFQKRENAHIIDLAKTYNLLSKACDYLSELKKANKTILFVGTKKQAVQIIKKYATSVNMPYIINRWIGGLLTNYKIVSKNIIRLNQLKKDLENKEFLDRYTKKEINEFKIEYSELLKIYEGVKDLNKLPDAIIIIDAHHEKTALLEARKKGIPVVAILDTNGNPDLIDYPVPANDDSFKSIELLTKTLAKALGYIESN